MSNRQPFYYITILFVFFAISLAVLPAGFASDQSVRETQIVLLKKGYDPGPIDGMLGKKTIQAIRNFQKDSSLPITGKLDPKTREALGIKSRLNIACKDLSVPTYVIG